MRRGLIAGVMVGLLAATAACGHKGGGTSATGVASGGAPAVSPEPKVTITPKDGSKNARPDQAIEVTASDGTLQNVTIKVKGADVPGDFSADRTSWKSKWTLIPGTSYQATATASGTNGKTATATSSFGTLTPSAPLRIINVSPGRDATVGVGMPITVDFNLPVSDKAAVEKSLEIQSDKPATGAWNWITSKEVIFRTKNGEYWPANQQVRFTAHVAGVKAGPGVYGMLDVTHNFKIGDKHVLTVNAKSDEAVARENGKVVKSWPVSLGSSEHANWITTSGIHLTMDHKNPEHMDSKWMGVDPKDKAHGGYSEDVPWATRITNSGEYVHQNMDDPTCLGNRNCSHGCVRSTLAGAKWFYNWSYLGDVVIVTGTSNTLAWNNGWGYYQKSWTSWLSGSALGKPVTTDGGSSPSPAPTDSSAPPTSTSSAAA